MAGWLDRLTAERADGRTARRTPRLAGLDGTARAGCSLAWPRIWLLDAVLQLQSFMFTKAFGQMLAATAPGNPAVIADPITWSARLIEGPSRLDQCRVRHRATVPGPGIAWRPTVKVALAASVCWSLGVWWVGEGLGGVLNGTADPVTGAPGAVIIYALLAVLLWPTDRDGPFEAARPFGAWPARLLWLALWGSFGLLRRPGCQPDGARAATHDLRDDGGGARLARFAGPWCREPAHGPGRPGVGGSRARARHHRRRASSCRYPAPAPPCSWRWPSHWSSGWSARTSAASWPGPPPTRTTGLRWCCSRPPTGHGGWRLMAFGKSSGQRDGGLRVVPLRPVASDNIR